MRLADSLEQAQPKLRETDAVRLAREIYGLEAAATRLRGEYDDNFLLATGAGEQRVLKVMHPARPRELVELQCAALSLLAERAPDLLLPRLCPAPSGEPIATVELPAATPRLVWMLRYVPGVLLVETRPHTPDLLWSLGRLLGRLDAALAGFSHPAAHRELKWDLARAGWTREFLRYIGDPARRSLAERVLERYEKEVAPMLPDLRAGIIHGDANDFNALVNDPESVPRQVISIVDFGDLAHTRIVCEPAIAAAYALLGKTDPLAAAAQVVAGYHSALPLEEKEIELIFPLIRTRLAVSVINSAWRKTVRPEDPYVSAHEEAAWEALERLALVHPGLAHYAFRQACGLPPLPGGERVTAWLRRHAADFPPVLEADLRAEPCLVFDLSVGSRLLGADPAAAETTPLTATLFGRMREAGVRVGVGRYDEARVLYTTPLFASGEHPTDERRTIHLGMDLFVEAGAPVRAPLEGKVVCAANNTAAKDYGPLIILEHAVNAGLTFYTLYGHLSEDSLHVQPGQVIQQGETFARIGAPPANGDWPPHLHFQIILDLLELGRDFPGVAFPSRRSLWLALSPDPNLILRIPSARFPEAEPSSEATLAARRKRVGGNVRLSYRRPLKVVRGWMQYLYDETGQAYLDAYNNVPIVGHSHPRVVRAAQEQIALLNTNTRYLHENIVRYSERLARLLPKPLRVCYFVNSASEANELGLRLARAHTGRRGVIVLEAAYHGHTTSLMDISPYKFGSGAPPWVRVATMPDDYRGAYRRNDPEAGRKYARHVGEILEQAPPEGGIAAFIAESLPSAGGQIVFPPGYLAEVYRYVRGAGGVCIADEVQVGFGRLGKHFWGFEAQGVAPDIVVLGKPIGNGFPLGAVVTTPEMAASFDNGMEFFSTFGGNPVACAVGLAVLEVIEEERLQERALRIGDRLIRGLQRLAPRHAVVGDVRGMGMFLGVELVRDRRTLEAAGEEASYVVNRLRELRILTGTEGPLDNVIKIRPPLPFDERDADLFLARLDQVLAEDRVRARVRE